MSWKVHFGFEFWQGKYVHHWGDRSNRSLVEQVYLGCLSFYWSHPDSNRFLVEVGLFKRLFIESGKQVAGQFWRQGGCWIDFTAYLIWNFSFLFVFLINLFVIRWLFLKTIRFRTRLPSAVFLISTIWAIIKLFFSRFWTELTPCVFFISSFDRWPVTVPRWITMSYYFLKLVSSFELKRILVNSLGAFNLCTSYKFILIILRAVWRWNLS